MPNYPNPYKYDALIQRSRSNLDVFRERLERKQKNRQETIMSLFQLLRIGSGLISSAQDRNKLIDYAKEKGFEYQGSAFSKAFGGGKFLKGGKEFTDQDISSFQYYEEIERSRNIFDEMFKDPTTKRFYGPPFIRGGW